MRYERMGLCSWWQNRETKIKLREENRRLKEQLLVKYKSEVPIFRKPIEVKKIMSTYRRRCGTSGHGYYKYIREALATDLVREIEKYLIINKTLNRDAGYEDFTATLYIADYKDSLSSNDWCGDDDVNIVG